MIWISHVARDRSNSGFDKGQTETRRTDQSGSYMSSGAVSA
jgi:hypothetical protein